MNKYFASLVLASLLFPVLTGNAFAQNQEFNTDEAIRTMEQHWDKLMREEDPSRRQQMIEEHRKLMDKTLDEAGVERFHMGMMHGDGMDHHMDQLTNTIEMHHMQMDMMEQ